MNERQDSTDSETAEGRRQQIAAREVRPDLVEVTMWGIPFETSRQFYTTRKAVDEWYPDGQAPWTRVQCHIRGRWHDTGVEMRLQREEGLWWVRVRRGKRYGKVWAVVAGGHEDPETREPNWWEIRCRGCGKPTRRDPIDFLGDVMFNALVKYRDRLTSEGKRPAGGWPPQIGWTAS